MNKLKASSKAIFWGICDSLKGFIIILSLDKELNRRQQERRSPTHSNSPVRRRQSESRDNTPVRTTQKSEESTITKRILQCGFLNGAIFLLSIILFDYGFLPLMKMIITIVFGKDASTAQYVWSWIDMLLRLTFQSIWVVPLFTISKFINNLWFQDIGQSAYKYSRGRPNTSLSLSKTVADFIFSSVVETLFLIQALVVTYIPILEYLCFAIYLIHLSLLYSLYAFEYKWGEMGWEIHKRLTCIETHWSYFIGFGLPLALFTQISSSWIINGCLFSIFFPFYIISANEANPAPEAWSRMQIFGLVIGLSNTIFSILGKEKKVIAQRPIAQSSRR